MRRPRPARRRSPLSLPPKACLSRDEVAGYVGLPTNTVVAIIRHVEGCDACRRAVAAAVRAARR